MSLFVILPHQEDWGRTWGSFAQQQIKAEIIINNHFDSKN